MGWLISSFWLSDWLSLLRTMCLPWWIPTETNNQIGYCQVRDSGLNIIVTRSYIKPFQSEPTFYGKYICFLDWQGIFLDSDLKYQSQRRWYQVSGSTDLAMLGLYKNERGSTSEQRLALGETFRGSHNLVQFLPFWAIFKQVLSLEHISSAIKSTIS